MMKSHELVKKVMDDLNVMEGILQGFPETNKALKTLIEGMRNTLVELAKLKGLPENSIGVTVDTSGPPSKAPKQKKKRINGLTRE